MKKDLRYLERLLAAETTSTAHPSIKKLAQFSDGMLTGEDREEVLAHLVQCEACRDLLIVPKNKRGLFWHLSRMHVVNAIVAVAASLILFMLIIFPKSQEVNLGMIDLSAFVNETHYKSPLNVGSDERKIDADSYLNQIIAKTDLSRVEPFQKAVLLEKSGDFIEARRHYKQAYIAIRHTADSDERIRQKIVINYRLLQLSVKEQKKGEAGIEAYRSMLRYDIAVYVLHHKEP